MKQKAKIFYIALDDFWRKEEKLAWLRDNHISQIPFERVEPDAKHNWINQTDNDWESLLPLIDKNVSGKTKDSTIFESFSTGFLTGRDEWVVDFSKLNLISKIDYYIEIYNEQDLDSELDDEKKDNYLDGSIKWSRNLKRRKSYVPQINRQDELIRQNLYRPFTKTYLYDSPILIDERGNLDRLFKGENLAINFRYGSRLHFCCIATDLPSAYSMYSLDPSQYFTLYRYDSENRKHENITDWALNQFQTHYGESANAEARTAVRATRKTDKVQENTLTNARVSVSKSGAQITKQDIFYYVYGVLHSPAYRKKYEQNLKREFPRLPFYDDFKQWRDWGAELMDLHINYETVEPFALERKDLDLTPKRKIAQDSMFDQIANKIIDDFVSKPKTKLRANKEQGVIEIDSLTQLTGVPAIAWEYKLGNRSALEWILDQYKEKKPSDATIAERFNTYKFEDYKEQTIDLLKRVCTVSVKTMEIVNQMPKD